MLEQKDIDRLLRVDQIRQWDEEDFQEYLEIIRAGEPYALDECLICSTSITDCFCADVGRCVICSAHTGLEDSGLCCECDLQVAHLPKN